MENSTKTYPSQVNTKAMACRVPAADYVKFLQDAISKGISMNDWLLMKVYQEPNKEQLRVNGIELHNHTTTQTGKEDDDESVFPISFDSGYNTEIRFENEEDVIDSFKDLISKYNELQDHLLNTGIKMGELTYQLEQSKKNKSHLFDFDKEEDRKEIYYKIISYVKGIEYEDESDKKEDLRTLRAVLRDVFLNE